MEPRSAGCRTRKLFAHLSQHVFGLSKRCYFASLGARDENAGLAAGIGGGHCFDCSSMLLSFSCY